MQWHNGPVRKISSDNGADVMHPVNEFDSGFYPGRFIQANHNAGLIVKARVPALKLSLDHKIPRYRFVKEMSVVSYETIMRFTPEVSMRIGKNGQTIVLLLPILRFIEPNHKVIFYLNAFGVVGNG